VTDLVRWLANVSAHDVAIAGGKGANLGELIRAGFPVPKGFVITTDAFGLVMGAAKIEARDPAAARDAMRSVEMPGTLVTAVRDAYRGLGSGKVAVRSSATAEDLAEASFAGQQDTILDVEGDDALFDAVRRCWASLWNERAVAYRATHRVDESGVRLAVVVQRMVDADTAGVLFTADPLRGTRRHAAIDAVRGLGEQLVSGAVNPDHYLVESSSGRVLERQGEVLVDARLAELARLGANVEEHFGRPQDIEWAIDRSGKLWLVQSRDITTLYPLPASAPDPERELRVYFSANVAQGVFQPFTPMGLQMFRLISAGGAAAVGRPLTDPTAGAPIEVEAGMRIFLDLTPMLRDPLGRGIVPRVFSVMEARSADLVSALLSDPRLRPRGSRRGTMLALALFLLRVGLPQHIVRLLLQPDATRARLLREVDEIVMTDAGPLRTATERVDAFQRLAITLPPRMFPRLVATVGAGYLAYNVAARLLRGKATQDEMRTLLRGLPHNPTTEMDLELWAIAQRTHGDPDAIRREMTAFLERYGHRAIAEIDIGLPRWSEDPAHLLNAIANYQRLGDDAQAPDAQFARGAREAEAMIETLAARVHGPARRIVRAMLRRARKLTGLREMPKFQIIRIFARLRAILAPVGDELAAAGRIASRDDVWFLSLPELRRAVAGEDMRGVVAAHRTDYEREMGRRHVPRILLSDGTDAEVAYAPPVAEGALRGSPASPGTAHGVARVILSPAGAHLEPGEVLVAPSTDPGWTPLFLTASALVMEMGGMMSHGAVVAREYGIPAVVGVPRATERISTGERIVVDGSAGTVVPEGAAV